MVIQRFEDIIAWQKAQNYAVDIYAAFNNLKDYGFKDQIIRAVVSISNNIAEGFDRGSSAEFARFINISMASCSETKSMLYLAGRLGYLSKEQQILLIEQSEEIAKILRGLLKEIKTNSK